jgi:peptidyl-prolyl cis-trans isomerase C
MGRLSRPDCAVDGIMTRGITISAWLMCAGFALGQFGPKPVAVVNGEPIPRSELEAVMKIRPQAVVALTAGQQREFEEQIVQLLVDEAIFRQFLNKNAPAIPPAEVEKQLNNLVASLKSKNKTLADYCKESHQTERQIRSGIEMTLRWNAYAAQKATDAELRKYYDENKDFFDKVTVKCSHIVFRVPIEAPAAERAEAEKRLKEIQQQIASGQLTFADAAKKYSQCPSGPKGGNLGYIHRKWMVEEPFAKAAFALQPNQMSNVVATDYGLHLILVTDRKPPEKSDFAKVKDQVRECYLEEMRLDLLDNLRKSAKVEINLQ